MNIFKKQELSENQKQKIANVHKKFDQLMDYIAMIIFIIVAIALISDGLNALFSIAKG